VTHSHAVTARLNASSTAVTMKTKYWVYGNMISPRKLIEICRWIYRFFSTQRTLRIVHEMEALEMKQWMISGVLMVALTGCASQAINEMNVGLGNAMGQHISGLERALGKPAEVVREGNQTHYRWFKESHIEPCNVDAWADVEGLIRKTSWSGYRVACEEFAGGLGRVFPNQ